MGFFERAAAPQQRSAFNSDEMWLQSAFFGEQSYTGEMITVDRSLQLVSVFGAIRVFAENIGSLPLEVFNTGGDLPERATGEGPWDLLRRRPNYEMTAVDCWATVIAHLKAWGNAYLGKDKVGDRVVALWPIEPQRVTVKRERGRKIFEVRPEIGGTGDIRTFTDADIIHIKEMSIDGMLGLSPIQRAREAIGLGLALDEYGNRFFANRATPAGYIKLKNSLNKEGSAERLKARWESLYRGNRNAHKVAVLEDGAEFEPLAIPMRDAMYVEQQNFTVQQIARLYGLPAFALGVKTGDSLTYANVGASQMQLRDALRPTATRIEQALTADIDLFPRKPNKFYEARFNFDELLRADRLTRYQAHALGVGRWLTPDEIRLIEQLPATDQFDNVPAPPPVLPDPNQQPPQGGASASSNPAEPVVQPD